MNEATIRIKNAKGKVICVGKAYDFVCPLEHNHEIDVSFNYETNEFKISKEEGPTITDVNERWDAIRKLYSFGCFFSTIFCYRQLTDQNVFGFLHQKDNYLHILRPICKECWNMKYVEFIQNYPKDFVSLSDYLNSGSVSKSDKEQSEKIKCPAFSGYPKFGKEDYKMFSDWDLKMINKFKSEIDLKWEKKPGEIKVENISVQEKVELESRRTNCKHQYRFSGGGRVRCKICRYMPPKEDK